jgi:outer membrane protein
MHTGPAILTITFLFAGAVHADTLDEALASAYARNPRINAERAKLRATDENVPQALSGYRPQLNAALSTGLQGVRNLLPGGATLSDTLRPSSASLTANQTLFNGMKTASGVRQAEAKVNSGRADLRAIEQDVLLDAATAYMAVLSNQSLVASLRVNVTFLRELLATTSKRYDAGDVTPTDVAQAQARLNRGLADLNKAEVALAASRATYIEVIGRPPVDLVPASPIDRLLPDTREVALTIAAKEHPTIIGATFEIDVAQWAIAIAQSGLYPVAGVEASALMAKDNDPTLSVTSQNIASVAGNLIVPVYDGGRAASRARQGKELLSQTRIWLERVRARTQTAVTAAWVTHKGARISLAAAESEVKAAQVAVAGVQTEARAGQRTTLDVLNAQQDLTAANARLILAQRDRVVASYALLSAMGRLEHRRLGLPTPDYDSMTHYQQVRDLPYGPNTPAGQ